MDSAMELQVREMLIVALAERFAQQAILTSADLSAFEVDGVVRRMKDRGKGIWNPQDLEATLTIVSDPNSKYDDAELDSSLFAYSYQTVTRGDPLRGPNAKLRRAMELGLPIIMLRQIAPQRFVPVMPVFVIDDDQANRRFVLALDESLRFLPKPELITEEQRRYAERTVRQRLHQPEFRAKVIHAYRRQCSICELKKVPLLDAAHISGDREDDGLPVVQNGLSLCKIHHSAFDERYIGIAPDFVVHVNDELLHETDGPMLKHGLQEMDGRKLLLPRDETLHPDRDRLAAKFERFLSA